MASTIKTLPLQFGLVSLPVKLRGASEKRDLPLDRAVRVGGEENKNDDGGEVRRLKRIDVIDPPKDATSLAVEQIARGKDGEMIQAQFKGDVIRGIWEGEDFYEIGSEEVEVIEEMTRLDAITIQEFVPLADVPWERAQASYYLAPGAPGGQMLKMLVTLRDVMAERGVAGVAKLMPKTRQKLALVYAKNDGLMVTCLAYAETFAQVDEGAAAMDGVEVSPEAAAALGTLIDVMTKPVEAIDEYADDLIELRADMIERARLGQPLRDSTEDDPTAAVEVALGADRLMDALRRSVEALQPPKKSRSKKAASTTPATSRGRAAKV